MTARFGLTTPDELETALADLGAAIELPPTPDIALALGERLRAAPTDPRSRPSRLFFW